MAQNTEQQDTREQQIETLARTLAGLLPDEQWATNAELGGHPMLGTRDDEYRDAYREQATELLDGPVARMIADAEQAAERRGAERVTAVVDAVIRGDLEAGLDSHLDVDGCGSCLAEAVHRFLHPEDDAL